MPQKFTCLRDRDEMFGNGKKCTDKDFNLIIGKDLCG